MKRSNALPHRLIRSSKGPCRTVRAAVVPIAATAFLALALPASIAPAQAQNAAADKEQAAFSKPKPNKPISRDSLSPEQSQAVTEAETYLNGIRDMEGRFIQIDAYGDLQQGKFYLRKPGRVRFEYDAPTDLLVVSDGTWVAVKEQGAIAQRYPLSQTPLGLVLDDRIDFFKKSEVRDLSVSDKEMRITMSDRSGEAPGSLTLVFDRPSPRLRQWIVTDAQGLQTTVALQDVQSGIKASNSLFTLPSETRPQIGSGKR